MAFRPDPPNAVIHIDTSAIHPVIDGWWHRARLSAIPVPGQPVVMLCGVEAIATFETLEQRRAIGALRQCAACDTVYRREHGIAPYPVAGSR